MIKVGQEQTSALVLLCMLLFLLIFAGYRFYFEEVLGRRNNLQQQLEKYELELRTKTNSKAPLIIEKEAYSNNPLFMNDINQLALANRVKLIEMHSFDSIDEADFVKNTFYLDLSGSYQQLCIFLKKWLQVRTNILVESGLLEVKDRNLLMHLKIATYNKKT